MSCAIGIDVGGTTTKIGLVRSLGESPGWQMVDHCVLPSNLKSTDPNPFLGAVFKVVEEYRQQQTVAGIGICLCSLLNEEHTGSMLSVNAPALDGLDIQQTFAERFGCPVRVQNDVNAYALAEYTFGAGRGVRRLLVLGLGTGLAIAVIRNGVVIESWAGVPADAGRIALIPDAAVSCAAGVRGSAESLIGTAHIERLARSHYQRHLPARQVILAAAAGEDPRAAAVIAEIGANAGHLLALLSPVFFPERILITGGTSEAGAPLFTAIRQRYSQLIGDYMSGLAALAGGAPSPVEIVKGALGPEASVLGAALEFLD